MLLYLSPVKNHGRHSEIIRGKGAAHSATKSYYHIIIKNRDVISRSREMSQTVSPSTLKLALYINAKPNKQYLLIFSSEQLLYFAFAPQLDTALCFLDVWGVVPAWA